MLNHAREQVALARRKGVNAREYVLASVKLKSSGTVYICKCFKLSFGRFLEL